MPVVHETVPPSRRVRVTTGGRESTVPIDYLAADIANSAALFEVVAEALGPVAAAAATAQRFTPRTYGAIGNYFTDDTAAVQACIDAASAASGIFDGEGASYRITAPLTITSPTKIVGNVGPFLTGTAGSSGESCEFVRAFDGDLFDIRSSLIMENCLINDDGAGGGTRNGAAFFFTANYDGSGFVIPGENAGYCWISNVRVTSTNGDPEAWQYQIHGDGSGGSLGGLPPLRSIFFRGCIFFGSREGLRFNNVGHWFFESCLIVPAPSTAIQMVTTLGGLCSDVHFNNCEGLANIDIQEGEMITFDGGRWGASGGTTTLTVAASCTGRFNAARIGGVSNGSLSTFHVLPPIRTDGTTNKNLGIGDNTLDSVSTGVRNVGIGYQTLDDIDTGSYCTALGVFALSHTLGDNNVGLGYSAGAFLATGVRNTAVGTSAIAVGDTIDDCTAVGYAALYNVTGDGNTGVGSNALFTTTSGVRNTAVGKNAITSNNTGNDNTALGYQALSTVNTGSNNCAVGTNALQSCTGSDNTAMGYQALATNTSGTRNAAFGYSALLVNVTSSDCTAVGYGALAASTAASNTAVGSLALNANTSGTRNTAVGKSAGAAITTGTDSTLVGWQAGTASTFSQVAGLGANCVLGAATTTALGQGANASHADSVALGQGSTTTAASQVEIGPRHIELTEVTAPAAGAGNSARLFAVNGGSDTQLKVAFSTHTKNLTGPTSASLASSGTPTPADGIDFYAMTGLTGTATFAVPSGTPVDGQRLMYRVKDNGTAQTLAWNAIYRAMDVALPTTTVISKTLYVDFVYNAADSKWDCLRVAQQA